MIKIGEILAKKVRGEDLFIVTEVNGDIIISEHVKTKEKEIFDFNNSIFYVVRNYSGQFIPSEINF